jgi:hypothetical protein
LRARLYVRNELGRRSAAGDEQEQIIMYAFWRIGVGDLAASRQVSGNFGSVSGM